MADPRSNVFLAWFYAAVESGAITPGSRVPTEVEVATLLDVDLQQARAGLAEWRAQGMTWTDGDGVLRWFPAEQAWMYEETCGRRVPGHEGDDPAAR